MVSFIFLKVLYILQNGGFHWIILYVNIIYFGHIHLSGILMNKVTEYRPGRPETCSHPVQF